MKRPNLNTGNVESPISIPYFERRVYETGFYRYPNLLAA